VYGFEYNDKVSFLYRDKFPYFVIIGFNNKKQIFLKPINDINFKWDIDYKIINIEKTPLFKTINIRTDYTNLPLFEEHTWSLKKILL